MIEKPQPDDRPPRDPGSRRRYEPPAIVSREQLEVIAVVCSPGKGPFEPGDCLLNTNS